MEEDVDDKVEGLIGVERVLEAEEGEGVEEVDEVGADIGLKNWVIVLFPVAVTFLSTFGVVVGDEADDENESIGVLAVDETLNSTNESILETYKKGFSLMVSFKPLRLASGPAR